MRRNELFPLGFFGLLFVNTLFNQWVVYAHSSGGSTGALLLTGFVFQGLLNPSIGHGSDLVRRRFGARRVLFLFTLPALLVVNAWLWLPGSPRVLAPLYCVAYSSVMQPFLALLPALARDEKTRLRFTLLGAVAALLAAASALLSGPFMVEHHGTEGLAVMGCTVLVIALGLPLLVMKEAPLEGAGPSVTHGLRRQLFELLSAPGVARFVGANLLLSATMMTLVVTSPFVAGALLAGRGSTQGLNGALVVGMVLSVALLGLVGKRVDPSTLFRLGGLIGATVLLVLGAASLSGSTPTPLWLVGFACLGYLALSTMALPSLIVAQLTTRDGKGREGLFFSLNGAATAFGNAIGAFVASSVLALSVGPQDPLGVQVAVAVALGLAVVASVLMPWRLA